MELRLVAADPDPVLLQIYRTYFSTFGFEVATAEDALECVALLRGFDPDVLVLNLELTWGCAEGVLSIIREDREMQPIPVVLTVGERRRSTVVKYLVPPVVKVFEKPFRLRDLRAAIESALRMHVQQWSPRVADAPAASGGNVDQPDLVHKLSSTHINQEGSRHV